MTRPDDLAAHCIKDVSAQNAATSIPPKSKTSSLAARSPTAPKATTSPASRHLLAGLPVTVAATTINRFCSSGLQAIAVAAHEIIHEGTDAAIGGGTESISMTPAQSRAESVDCWNTNPAIYMVMGDTAEVVAKRYKVSRQAQDEYSLESQQRTARAQNEGFFQDEIAPMRVSRPFSIRRLAKKSEPKKSAAIATSAIGPTPPSKVCSPEAAFRSDQRRRFRHRR